MHISRCDLARVSSKFSSWEILWNKIKPLQLRGGNDKDFKPILFTKKVAKPAPKPVRTDDDAVPLTTVPHELKMAIMKARQVMLYYVLRRRQSPDIYIVDPIRRKRT